MSSLITYKDLQTEAHEAISAVGTKLTLSRDDAPVAKSKGVLIGRKQDAATGITEGEAQVLISPKIKVPPLVGDYIAIKDTLYYVSAVEEVKPAEVVLLYKADVS